MSKRASAVRPSACEKKIVAKATQNAYDEVRIHFQPHKLPGKGSVRNIEGIMYDG